MSDSKVKVAVRVRPMNRRGKWNNDGFFWANSCLCRFWLHATFTVMKVCISTPLLLPSLNSEPEFTLKNGPTRFESPPPNTISVLFPQQTCFCRNWTEYKMCRGYGGQPDSSTPTTLQCKGREQVNKFKTLSTVSVCTYICDYRHYITLYHNSIPSRV